MEGLAKPPSTGMFEQGDDTVFGRARRDRGAHDDGMRALLCAQRLTDRLDHAVDRIERDAAVRCTWRAYRNKGDVGAGHRGCHIGGGGQPPLLDGTRNQGIDRFLDDRRAAAGEHGDLVRGNIDADDVMPKFGEAAAGDNADIADAENGNTHALEAQRDGTAAV